MLENECRETKLWTIRLIVGPSSETPLFLDCISPGRMNVGAGRILAVIDEEPRCEIATGSNGEEGGYINENDDDVTEYNLVPERFVQQF